MRDTLDRVNEALSRSIAGVKSAGCPPKLAEAMRYAVFPGGARIRPRLCLSVAAACQEDEPATSNAAAVAIELLHCASLVHDDLPCFDDAEVRRGKTSVHKVYGEEIAVLAGDGLIVLAFECLATSNPGRARRSVDLVEIVARSVSAARGIIGGQAWESETAIDLKRYHNAKTGSLFAASTEAGAVAAGADGAQWRALGARLGEAYQVADDIRDAFGDSDKMGKPVGKDVALGRPSAVAELGIGGAKARLKNQIRRAVEAIPECPGAMALRDTILFETNKFLPPEILRQAA
ncbi:MAG: polyprenyl synthetase family protein [Rhodospirillaceae bacterium]|nr:polyprenyl synthetase family protein [Rhodospirillaceae bacterium]MCY4238659.1 polyprenyl synthetase family protein [Rhodospirillaceae bacterium]